MHPPVQRQLPLLLGPVNTTEVAGAESQFFSVRGVRSDAYRGPHGRVLVRGVDTGCLLATIDEEMRKTGPGPKGCGANRAIRCCRFRLWSRHSLQTPPSLARFSLATPAAPVVLTGPSASPDQEVMRLSTACRRSVGSLSSVLVVKSLFMNDLLKIQLMLARHTPSIALGLCVMYDRLP